MEEQARIAGILDAVDEAIRSTDRLISKLEQAKQGLLHDLLTCGIDKTGRLRDPHRDPDHFVQTRLGLLPKAWPIVSIRDVVASPGSFIQTGPFGSQLHAYEYVPDGIPVIMPQDISDLGAIIEVGISRVGLRKAEALRRHRMRSGDVVFARRGDLSKCADILSAQDGWLCGTGCLLLRPPKDVLSKWLVALYRHDICQRQVEAAAVGSTMVNLNATLLANLEIPLPRKEEQDQICRVISAERVEVEQAIREVAKLRLLRQGLMDDLLTGRVRVNVEEGISA
jgi:type I restriction enzyme S subunit